MTIRIKILGGCLLLTLLTGLLGVYSQVSERRLGALALDIYDNAFMAANYLRSSEVEFGRLADQARQPEWSRAAAADSEHDMLTDLDVVRERAMSAAGRQQAVKLRSHITALLPHLQDDRAGVNAASAEFDRLVETFADDGFRYRKRVGRMVADQMAHTYEVIGGSLLAALVITMLVNNLIAPPVRAAVRIAQSIAAGRLDNPIIPRGRGETADLLRALAAMQTSIAAGISRIKALMDAQAESHAEEIAVQHAQMEAALGNMIQGLCLFDAAGTLLVANRRFEEMFTVPSKGQTCEEVLVAARLGMLVEAVRDGKAWTLSCELDDGREIAVEQTQVTGGGWVATFEDVTFRRVAERQMEHLARRDELTGLPNRIAFEEHLCALLSGPLAKEGIALLCVDLDRFRYVNDALGRQTGDLLLRRVAERLAACVVAGDTLMRLGSDEFAIIQVASTPERIEHFTGALSGLGQPEAATSLAQRLLAALAEPFDVAGQQIDIGGSIGIAVSQDNETTMEPFMKSAVSALQRAKTEGGGIWRFFEPDMDMRMRARRDMELDLREAVESEQFEVFYQPLILHSAGIIGFEALVRWHHPVIGLLEPADFIQLANEAGLLPEIGGWVLRRACIDAASWPAGLRVSVNLSASQFSPDLIETVASILSESHLAPEQLELEITETTLSINGEMVVDMLHRLRALGTRIAIDDFGTGHSSLGSLGRFAFDTLKIHQSCIQNMTARSECLTVARGAIGLGRSLGLLVTAEGVETEEQLNALVREGCRVFQGYLFSEPRPAGEISGMLHGLGVAAEEATA